MPPPAWSPWQPAQFMRVKSLRPSPIATLLPENGLDTCTACLSGPGIGPTAARFDDGVVYGAPVASTPLLCLVQPAVMPRRTAAATRTGLISTRGGSKLGCALQLRS